MHLTLLKAKLHRACVTHVELEYEGSCAIDSHLLETAGIQEYEQIHVYNLANGERFITYVIRAKGGSGIVSVNGAAAHKAAPGEHLIICAYAMLEASEAASFNPTLVYLDAQNQITHTRHTIPAQVA